MKPSHVEKAHERQEDPWSPFKDSWTSLSNRRKLQGPLVTSQGPLELLSGHLEPPQGTPLELFQGLTVFRL